MDEPHDAKEDSLPDSSQDPLSDSFDLRMIDPVFHSAYEEGPFTQCLVCENPFVKEGVSPSFLIMKVLVNDETILELAMCEPCRARMRDEISVRSRDDLNRFLEERFHPDRSIDSCAVRSRAGQDCRSKSIYAGCLGELMIVAQYPFMICDQCEEVMQELLSEETRGWQDDFMDRHFSGPSLSLEPERRPLLI